MNNAPQLDPNEPVQIRIVAAEHASQIKNLHGEIYGDERTPQGLKKKVAECREEISALTNRVEKLENRRLDRIFYAILTAPLWGTTLAAIVYTLVDRLITHFFPQ